MRATLTSPVSSAATNFYRPDIDGLRAVAVLAVVIYHAFPEFDPAGFIGVDIFFVISGYLISSIILDRLEVGRFSFLDFYAHRARRIFPALFAVLATCLVAGSLLLLPREFRELGTHVAAASLFFSNFLLWHETGYFDAAAEAKPLLHLWSLGIEEQFYLLWPLLLALAWRAKKAMPLLTCLLAVASFAYCFYATFNTPAAAFYSPAARWWELMAGGLLAQIVAKRALLPARWATVASVVGAALLVATLLLLDPSQPFPGAWSLAPVLAACLLLFAGHDAWFNKVVLSNRLLVGIGLISYPLYLWHWPLLSFARILHSAPLSASTTLAILAASVALAWLTYLLVERPIRFGPHAKQRTKMIAPALFALLAVAGAAGVSVRAADGFGSRPVIGQVRPAFVVDNPVAAHLPCPDLAAMPAILAKACYSHVNLTASHIVILWGDSHALPWSVDFESMAEKDGFQLYVLKLEGCPPLTGVRRTDIKASQAVCDTLETTRALLDAIEALHPDAVVMTARWSNFSHGWIRNGRLMAGDSFLTTSPYGTATRATSRQALAERIPATIGELRAQGISVVVIRNPPVLKFEVTNLRKSIAELEVTPAEHNALSSYTDEIFARTGGFELFDPAELLCSAVCRAVIDGHELYVDDNHLGLFGAKLFEGQLDALTRRVLAARP